MADSKAKTFRDLDDSSDPSIPHYEINWYLPDRQLNDKYHFKGGFNKNTLVIQVTSFCVTDFNSSELVFFVLLFGEVGEIITFQMNRIF